MTIHRHAARSDTSRAAIVKAIRQCGWHVWDIKRPVDILCWKPGRGFKPLEIKTPSGKKNPKAIIDKRQKDQIEFIELTGTPRVITPEQAINWLEGGT